MSRASGRTFRKVLACLIEASSGEKVILVTSNHCTHLHTTKMIRLIASAHAYHITENSVIFSNGGSLTVKTLGGFKVDGLSVDKVVYDDRV